MEQRHREAISKALKGHKVSEETKRKIGLANLGVWVKFNCDNCKKQNEEQKSKYIRSKYHFCNTKCRAQFFSKLPYWKQTAYKGIRKNGQTKQIYYQRYAKSHPERIAHLKARRYARQRDAKGSHTLEEWQELKRAFGYKCANCGEVKELTKDHIKPLSLGGTDYISNIQPLCRSCNSKKWKKF